ncbi:MAG: HD-GYP domain-containing protein [Mycobacterium leprae]
MGRGGVPADLRAMDRLGLLRPRESDSRSVLLSLSGGPAVVKEPESIVEWLYAGEAALTAFLEALKVKSPITGQHSIRVSRYAAAMAGALNLSQPQVYHLERCGLLHDIGKLGISDRVLEKPGDLNPEEWVLIKGHPEIGVRAIETFRVLSPARLAIAMHHERFDGSGYPYALSGYQIPLEARIVGICDAYDTMTSDRPYRKALEPDEAVFRLRKGAGTQFDPLLVQVFATRVVPMLLNSLLQKRSPGLP